jgi:3-oxoacyl-[acyl-carrier-protein] synthase III
MISTTIIGSGSYIPEQVVTNDTFLQHTFHEKNGVPLVKNNQHIISKFKDIAGIGERRYATQNQRASDLGFFAAREALHDADIDPETLDYIIVAHNFGDVTHNSNRVDTVPSLASRIKAQLKIKNPDCVAYDLPFGCPGWVEALIQADYFIRSGDVKRCLIIGTETLSRVIDPYDRDSMLYSDGSGAVVVEASPDAQRGVIAHKSQTHAADHAMLLTMGHSYCQNGNSENLYIKMNGRKVYEFALNQVPLVIQAVIEKAQIPITAIHKILIHQANDKMDQAIVERVFKLYGYDTVPENLVPMTIGWLGNSSVATIPTLLDLILKNKLSGHQITSGDLVLLASVGAGMNINAVLYRF